MRIVVNDIAASSGGVLTVLKDFYQYVKENDKENEWFFLVSDDYIEPTENIHVIKLPEIKKSYIKRLKFDFLTGKKLIKSLNADYVFSLQNTLVHGVDVPQTVYQHQPLPFQDVKNYSFFKKDERKMAVYQHLIGKTIFLSAKKADKLIVQTEWMREAIVRKCSVNADKIVESTPDRRFVWNVQTPQVFDYMLVSSSYAKALEGDCSKITDDAMVVETYGNHEVVLYEGSYENIKITTPSDLVLAEEFVKIVLG